MSEEITYKGCRISISQDEYVDESPLDWSTPEERGATFVLHHRRYNLPNELDVDFDEYEGWRELAAANVPEGQPVYRYVQWYEHSGVSVSISETPDVGGWDSGCAGVIYGENIDTLNAIFREWKQYIEGDIWSYEITDQYDEHIDSLSGIYGYDEAINEAKSFIDEYQPPRDSTRAVNARRLHV